MKLEAIRSIIVGNLEAVAQGESLIRSLSDEQYRHIAKPYVQSSIGQHFRHVIDMFVAVVISQESGVIDYDQRRRGSDVETNRSTALSELDQIKCWLGEREANLSQHIDDINAEVSVKSEVGLEATRSEIFTSTRLRELVFTSSHAVHHYALISVIAKLQGLTPSVSLGIAPATATFMRDEAVKHEDSLSCAQ